MIFASGTPVGAPSTSKDYFNEIKRGTLKQDITLQPVTILCKSQKAPKIPQLHISLYNISIYPTTLEPTLRRIFGRHSKCQRDLLALSMLLFWDKVELLHCCFFFVKCALFAVPAVYHFSGPSIYPHHIEQSRVNCWNIHLGLLCWFYVQLPNENQQENRLAHIFYLGICKWLSCGCYTVFSITNVHGVILYQKPQVVTVSVHTFLVPQCACEGYSIYCIHMPICIHMYLYF